jgi:hypothetical protein
MPELRGNGVAKQAGFCRFQQNRIHRCRKVFHRDIGLLPKGLGVAVIDEDRPATGGMRAIDILPAIANLETGSEIDVERGGGAADHSGRRLSAITRLAVFRAGVKADLEPIENANDAREPLVDRFDHRARLLATADVRLIGYHDKKEPGLFQPRTAVRHVLEDLEFVCRIWRVRFSGANGRFVQNAVAVEKNTRLSDSRYFVLSHLVCATLSVG